MQGQDITNQANVIHRFGKRLTVLKGLGQGRWGGASLVQDSQGKKYTLKVMEHAPYGQPSTYNDKEAEINQKLGRLYGYEKAVPNPQGWKEDYLLLEHIEGKDMLDFLDREKNVEKKWVSQGDNGEGEDIEEYKQSYLKNPQGRFPTGLARNLMIALRTVEALERIEQKGVIQNDMKMENLVVNENQHGINVEVIDFGKAEITRDPRNIQPTPLCWVLGPGREGFGLLPRREYEKLQSLLGENPSYNQLKVQLRKMFDQAMGNVAAPVMIRSNVQPNSRTNPQAYLEYCIKNGLQKGAISAFEHGAHLTRDMVNLLSDRNFQSKNPKTHQALAPYVLAYQQHIDPQGGQSARTVRRSP